MPDFPPDGWGDAMPRGPEDPRDYEAEAEAARDSVRPDVHALILDTRSILADYKVRDENGCDGLEGAARALVEVYGEPPKEGTA